MQVTATVNVMTEVSSFATSTATTAVQIISEPTLWSWIVSLFS